MKRRERILLTLIIPLFFICVTTSVLLLYTRESEKNSKRLTGEILLAAANEQSDLFSVKLESEITLLKALSATLSAQELSAPESLIKTIALTAEVTDFRNLLVTDTSGEGISDDGQQVQLKDRDYLAKALAGEIALEHLAKTRLENDDEAIAIAVPITVNQRIIGAAVGILEESALRDMFKKNLYWQSETFVCDAEGTVIVNSEKLVQLGADQNFFSALSTQQETEEAGAAQFIRDIQSGTPGFQSIAIADESWYIAYIQTDYNGWTVVRIMPTSLVDNSVMQERGFGYLVVVITMIGALVAIIFVVGMFSNTIHNSRRERKRLLKIEEEYRIAAKQSGIAIIRINTETGEMISSQGAIEQFKLLDGDPDEPFCHAFDTFVIEESREELDKFRQSMLQGKPSGKAEIGMRNVKGELLWLEFEFASIGDGGGNSSEAIVTIRDITTLRERIAAYRRWQSMLADAVGISAALMEINATSGVCERAEGEFSPYRLEGKPQQAEDILARYCENHVAPEDRAAFLAFTSAQRLLNLYRRGQQADETELHLLLPDGRSRLRMLGVQLAYAPKNDDVLAFLIVRDFENITQEVDRLNDLAMRDGLSGLLNRTAAQSAIEEALHTGNGELVALFIIDADNFKQVNDMLGHQYGDLALKQMSAVIRGAFRASDIVARVGGDEFFVFLPEVPADRFAEEKAEALCKNLQITYPMEERGSVTMTASIGVIVARRENCDFESLYADADRVLYEAKNAGKNRYHIRYDAGEARTAYKSAAGAGSSLQLNTLMKQLDGGVVLLEGGERVTPLFISEGYFLLKGTMREAIENGTFPESVIHPHDYPQFESAIRACIADGVPFQMSYRNVLSGGGYGWRHINAVLAPSLRENVPVILAVISDITELHDATERLETLAASAKVGVFIMRIGERLEITFFNDGALTITGFSYDQMRLFARDASAFFRGDNLKHFRAEVAAASVENRMVNYLYESQGFLLKKKHSVQLYGVKLDEQNGIPSYLILLLEQDDII